MLAKRIIPCLDVTDGRVVKGVNFLELRDAGDPVEIARRYDEQGADELTFLDITASSDNRGLILHIIEEVASQVFIPLTVGGGVREVEDVRRLLNAGADKVSINTSAVLNPQLVADASDRYGAQCIVVAIDAKKVSQPGEANRWEIFTHGGRKGTGIDAVEWAVRGAGAATFVAVLSVIQKNGVDKDVGSYSAIPSYTIGFSTGSALIQMNGTTDYIELLGYVNAGGTCTVGIGSFLSGSLVSPAP